MKECNLIQNLVLVVCSEFQQPSLNGAQLFNQRLIHCRERRLRVFKAAFQLQLILGGQPFFSFRVQALKHIAKDQLVLVHMLMQCPFHNSKGHTRYN
ncbi:hypothetical protein D3C85_1567810 [compost metagenome]